MENGLLPGRLVQIDPTLLISLEETTLATIEKEVRTTSVVTTDNVQQNRRWWIKLGLWELKKILCVEGHTFNP